MSISDLLHSERGAIAMSIILGLGLAALFRKACVDNQGNACVIVKGPKLEETAKTHYKIDKTCYKYDAVPVDCK